MNAQTKVNLNLMHLEKELDKEGIFLRLGPKECTYEEKVFLTMIKYRSALVSLLHLAHKHPRSKVAKDLEHFIEETIYV
jgi:hypothetical protein